jgi:hypothetical protein
MVIMKRHFSVGPSLVACGKNDHTLVGTMTASSVSCKACRYTQVFRDAAKQNYINSIPSKPVKSEGLLPKQFWRQRIESLPGRNQLPRGFALE